MLYGIVIAAAMLKNGDPEEFKKASVRLKERTAQLKQYCSEHDLTYMNERTSVLGYGHSEASKVTAAYRKTLQNEQLTLDKIANDDIIKGRGNGLSGGSELTQKVKRVGSLDPNDREAVTSTLERFEKKYRNKDCEYALVISRQGDVYLARGQEGNVDTTVLLGKDIMRDSWNTHNHPPGTGAYTFSKDDNISFGDDGSYCMRATDSVFTYELIRANKMPSQTELRSVYTAYKDSRWELLEKAGKTMDDVAYDEEHIVVEKMAEHFGMIYRRWKNE